MAMMDYGALLRINGEFINKDKGLFMSMKDMCGFEIESALCLNGDTVRINGNYFIYVGEPDLLLCFYKNIIVIVQNSVATKFWCGSKFDGEIFYIGDAQVKVELINKNYKVINYDKPDKFDVARLVYLYGTRKSKRIVHRLHKQSNRKAYKQKVGEKYLATWEYNGNKYEVVFGYGVEPKEKVYNDIKYNSYDYTKEEIELIDSWFQNK